MEINESEIYKLYIKKAEDLLAEISRRSVNAEMNSELNLNAFKAANEQLAEARQLIEQKEAEIFSKDCELHEIRDQLNVKAATKQEFDDVKKELARTTKQRDDFQYELQQQCNRNNKLSNDLELAKLTIIEQENTILDLTTPASVKKKKIAKH